MSYRERFSVKPGGAVHLAKVDPAFTGDHENKASAAAALDADEQRLRDLQYLLYAEGRRSVLICLQALDAGGKDGTIRHVLRGLNPQGTHVHAFKAPVGEEARHDFLWRAHLRAPAFGDVAIFNRSHYESVLVERVHQLVPKSVWSARYELINEFEENLAQNGTRILKFYLHISPDEQLRRFKDRLDDPARQWKISEADYTERALWPQYMEAYEDALARTSTADAPWFIIPADHKWFRDLAVARIIVETLVSMNLHTPSPTVDIQQIRLKYHDAKARKR